MVEDEHREVMERLKPWASDDWDAVVQNFRTMRVRLHAEYLPSNRHPTSPLLALVVEQLDEHLAPIWGKPGSVTPLHISIAFYDRRRKREFDRVYKRYARPREVVLHGWIQGSTFALHPPDPIAGDADVQNLARSDPWYGHKGLHISL